MGTTRPRSCRAVAREDVICILMEAVTCIGEWWVPTDPEQKWIGHLVGKGHSRAPRFLWTAFCEKENELCPRENSARRHWAVVRATKSLRGHRGPQGGITREPQSSPWRDGALLHESSLARTMPTDRILTGRCDTTLVDRGRSSDSRSHSRGRPHSPARLGSGREGHRR